MHSLTSGRLITKAAFALSAVAVIGTLTLATGAAASQDQPTGNNAPQTKDACKHGGYKQFGFTSQGKCIQYVVKHNHHNGYGNDNDGDGDHNGQGNGNGNGQGNDSHHFAQWLSNFWNSSIWNHFNGQVVTDFWNHSVLIHFNGHNNG